MAYSGSEVTQLAPWGSGMGQRPAFSAKAAANTESAAIRQIHALFPSRSMFPDFPSRLMTLQPQDRKVKP